MISAVRNCHFMKGDMKINLKRLTERKDLVVEGSRTWVDKLLAGKGVTVLRGEASFTSARSAEVRRPDGEMEHISFTRVIVATGAVVDHGPRLWTDGDNIWSTEDALALKTVPRSLAIIGADSRGVEFTSIYHNLGARVVLIEKEKRILPRIHPSLSNRYKRILTERKIKVMNRTNVVAVGEDGAGGVTLNLETEKSNEELKVDKVLLIGFRRPHYSGLNLEAAGLSLYGEALEYGPGMQTLVEGIYVVGDAAGPPYLAHKAIAQAIAAVDHLLGIHPDGRPKLFPICVWGDPEIGSVGLTEEDADERRLNIKVGEFYFVGNGRSGTIGNTQGLVKILSDAKAGTVLGVHIIGPQATELVSLASLAMQNGVDVAGIKRTVFPHPTLAEAFFEAALATDGEAIHLLLKGVEYESQD
jgi:dihydrolipoamide dehydrogenase